MMTTALRALATCRHDGPTGGRTLARAVPGGWRCRRCGQTFADLWEAGVLRLTSEELRVSDLRMARLESDLRRHRRATFSASTRPDAVRVTHGDEAEAAAWAALKREAGAGLAWAVAKMLAVVDGMTTQAGGPAAAAASASCLDCVPGGAHHVGPRAAQVLDIARGRRRFW